MRLIAGSALTAPRSPRSDGAGSTPPAGADSGQRMADGFTLVEVLIATALFAMVMGMYSVVLNNVITLEEEVRAQRSFSSIGPAILDLIEDDLQSLYTSPRQPDAFPFRGDEHTLSSKPADRMVFVARRASIHQEDIGGAGEYVRSPINELGYRLRRGDSDLGDVRRIYRREAYYVDGSPLDGGDFFEIYDRVVSFDVTYAGYPVEESERSSQDTLGQHRLEKFESWDSEERRGFPAAVIITIEVEPPSLGGSLPERGEERRVARFTSIIPILQAGDIPAHTVNPGNTTYPGTGNTGR